MAFANTIDPAHAAPRLHAWLAGRLDDATDVQVGTITIPTSSGMSTETVMFEATWSAGGERRAQRCVARVQPRGDALFPSYDLTREAAIMRALAAHTDVPVPAVLFEEPGDEVFDAPFFVMERIDGEVPGDDPPFTTGGWVMGLDAAARTALCANGLEVLAKIHGADLAKLPVADGTAQDGAAALDAQLRIWERFAGWATDGATHPTIGPALEWLRRERPASPGEAVLSWGDARLGNMLFGPDQQVNAVLDWEMAGIAPRGFDLAWWMFITRHHTEGIGVPLPSGFPTAEQTVERYTELTGHQPRDLHYYEAFAATRLSILVVRAAGLMIGAGLLPADSQMAFVNPATNLLADLLGLPAPEGEAAYYIGNR